MVDPKFIRRALATGLITEAEAQRFLEPDAVGHGPEPNGSPDTETGWPRWTSDAERLTEAVHDCASGAAAFESVNVSVIEVGTGRTLPAPPTGAKP